MTLPSFTMMSICRRPGRRTDPVGALGEHREGVAAVGQEAVGDDPVGGRRVEHRAVERDAGRVDAVAERRPPGRR